VFSKPNILTPRTFNFMYKPFVFLFRLFFNGFYLLPLIPYKIYPDCSILHSFTSELIVFMKFPLSLFFTCASKSPLSTCVFWYFKTDVSFSSHRYIIYFVPHRFSVKVNATSQDVMIKEKFFSFSFLNLHDCKCSCCVLSSLTK